MIVIVKGIGNNFSSIQMCLNRLGYTSQLSNDINVINKADKVILPGVGHAAVAMESLRSNKLYQAIRNLTQPVLGICLGMQLLYDYTEEGQTSGLGIISGNVKSIKVPKNQPLIHMGWNKLDITYNSNRLIDTLNVKDYVYYVHRYCASISEDTVATSEYGEKFSAIVKRDNFFGMQFHPEKSATVGERLLNSFLQGDL